MKCGEAVEMARTLRPAAAAQQEQWYYNWLTETEQEIAEHMNRHEPEFGRIPDPITGKWMEDIEYTAPVPASGTQGQQDYVEQVDNDLNTELILEKRFEMIYVYKLMCEIDMTVGEIENYNKDATLYNQLMTEWKAWYRREHMPKNTKRRGWIIR